MKRAEHTRGTKPNQMSITKARMVLTCLRMKNEADSVYADHVRERVRYLEINRKRKEAIRNLKRSWR